MGISTYHLPNYLTQLLKPLSESQYTDTQENNIKSLQRKLGTKKFQKIMHGCHLM